MHTTVAVLREGKDAFSYLPSQPLRDQWAYFKVAGDVDIVSHADRLRQSPCFLASLGTARPSECATCHDPHRPHAASQSRSAPCQGCHPPAALEQRLARSAVRADHAPGADCVRCHMPRVQERGIPHGTFTDHWIRVVTAESRHPTVPRSSGRPVEPFYDRDRTGPDADVYRGMGEVVYATLAGGGRALGVAAAALDRALAVDSSHGEAHFLLGVAYEQLGRTDAAARALERAVRIDSARPDRLRALARAYEREGRPPAAIDSLYRRALSLQPALSWVRADYADFLHGQGRHDEAIRAYRDALAEEPSLATAWFNLGTVLTEAGRTGDAADAFRRADRLDPSLGEALSSLLEVRTTGAAVTGVHAVEPPLAIPPADGRPPAAVRLTIPGEAGAPRVRLVNVPPGALVKILAPDGTLVRALRAGDGAAVDWDLRTETGTPIGGGLYRARVQERPLGGRTPAAQVVSFGVVRRRAE